VQLWLFLLLMAQAQAPDPLQELQLERRLERFAQAMPRRTAIRVAKPKVCSIPLINVLPSKDFKKDKITVTIPREPRAELRPHSGDYVTPPAPPCDDERQ
jgi:hypothetical protein